LLDDLSISCGFSVRWLGNDMSSALRNNRTRNLMTSYLL